MSVKKSFSDLLFKLKKLKQNFGLVFWLLFLMLLIFELATAYGSLKVIWTPIMVPAPSNQNKGVRINFNNYNQVVRRIETAASYVPTTTPASDPFNAAPKPLSSQPTASGTPMTQSLQMPSN